MAFGFFKDKSKGPLEVTCPLCEHTQQESPLAVSSYCKGCKAYLTFKKGGEIIARAQATPDPFAHRPAQPKVEIEYKAREEKLPGSSTPRKIAKEQIPQVRPEPKPKPDQILKPETSTSIAPDLPTESEAPTGPEKSAQNKVTEEEKLSAPQPAQTHLAQDQAIQVETEREEQAPRYHRQPTEEDDQGSQPSKKKMTNERLVTCFECGDSHVANALANSTQCRKCGRLISLADQHIKEAWSSRIQTRGNVFIHKKGLVLGASIQCHDLTVEGDFTGSAECSGDLILRRHGKIIGNVICNRLLVEKRAKVEFLNIVEMNECRIDGLVTGNLSCRGRLALEKKATLNGNIKVGTLTVADGAKHTGQIQMGGF